MTIDTDRLAEGYFAWVDPAYQDDETPDEGETLQHISTLLDRVFEDLTAEEFEIAKENVDEIQMYIGEILDE